MLLTASINDFFSRFLFIFNILKFLSIYIFQAAN